MSLPTLPEKCCVAVIGGGPAGSSTATLLAREGVDVVVLEREKFPRYHIGESLLLSARQMFELMGLEEKVAAHGFIKKYGAYFKIKHDLQPGHIDFSKSGRYNYSYQVIRSEFDKLLLDHSVEQGARVFEETRVTDIEFRQERPVALNWARENGEEGRLEFDYLVDASGLSGLMATKYLKSRVYQENFANIAVGRYFRGYRPYRDEEPGAFYMEALTNSSGWCWYIPLHDGTVSVGVVVHRDVFGQMKEGCGGDVEATFQKALELCPDITRLLTEATTVGGTHVWQDYSYVSDRFAGPYYRMAGDAAGFIDPFFSSGVHLALLGALSAAASICSSLKGDIDEHEAGLFHDRCVRRAYTRFVLAVSGAYIQIRNQKNVVLHGVADQDMQLAFNMLQPVVSGSADALRTPVSKETLKKALKYISDSSLEGQGVDTGSRISKLIARQRETGEYQFFTDITSIGAISGRYIRAERGRLGLARTSLFQSLVNKVRLRAAQLIGWRLFPELLRKKTAPGMDESQDARLSTATAESPSLLPTDMHNGAEKPRTWREPVETESR